MTDSTNPTGTTPYTAPASSAPVGSDPSALENAKAAVTDSVEATRLKRTMIARSHRTVLLADHSKFGRFALETICPWNEIASVITDRPPPPEFREIFELQGVELIVVGEMADAGAK